MQKYQDIIYKSIMKEVIPKSGINMYNCYNNLWFVLYDEYNKRYIQNKTSERLQVWNNNTWNPAQQRHIDALNEYKNSK